MPVYKLTNGRYQASIQDTRRNIPRTKRTFDTRKEAADWLAAVKHDAHARLLGHQRRHLFGEALARYLREESPKKRTHKDDVYNARALRYPIADGRRWLRLELLPLDEIPAAMSTWSADQRAIVKRSYIGDALYQLRRRADDSLAWYHQPSPHTGQEPPVRVEVTDPALIEQLQGAPGRGPVTASTLRIRQALVRRVLRVAWERWNSPSDIWLTQDIARRIKNDKPTAPRVEFLLYDQLLALLIHAPIHFDDAILGAAWIGWRRGNVIGSFSRARGRDIEGLTWDRVVFSVYDEHQRLVQPGYILASETKNGRALAQPLSKRVEQLLQLRWSVRNGRYVFHRGDGRTWGDAKRVWLNVKRAAGIPTNFRWHGLRHTWASELARANVDDARLQALGGWSDPKMVRVYAHLRLDDLLGAVNLNREGGTA